MSDVPDHLFTEILRRVPVDSLFRFRSVCKTWRGIIDDPGFAKLHINGGLGERSILIRSYTGKFFLLPMSTLINNSCVFCDAEGCEDCCLEMVDAINVKPPVVGHLVPGDLPAPSCNGMLLLMSNYEKNCVIWNPFTGESVEGPQLSAPSEHYICFTRMGFGYDDAKNDYKIVWAYGDSTFIYSVNSGVSTVVEDLKLPDRCYCQKLDGVFANGALHWIASVEEGVQQSKPGFIVSLDLTTETYRFVDFPKQVTECLEEAGGDITLELLAFNGCLFLTCRPTFLSFEAWKIDGGAVKNMMSWEKSNINLIAYLEGEEKVLSAYDMDDDFPWYYTLKNCLQKVPMEVNPYAREDDSENLYEDSDIYDTFSFQILPSSLARLKVSDYGAN